ncbi:putative MATE family efflux protein [Stella humosa]|uniref:Putative MATE family efflux protein n=1 Tax=Stella humosa TaxID=94 RepID=A0A3N1KPJ1_9PROT|nr:MATE family efflux transporter [Stella humosa]ROP81212.1 putative MATE family efflux protein [Stella humosa]BBK32559.1 MATE family efflux transporter [Stella humosa]
MKPAAPPDRAARARKLLEGPILLTLLGLAAPNFVVMLTQTAASFAESYYVGLLGTDALAGAALVFPMFMLMQMMSAGGMGGGISSAVARAVGAGRLADAEALALHAVVIALVFGGAFTAAALIGGPALYRTMGGRDAALEAALAYSNTVFLGATMLWLLNSLANVLRGSGNMVLPAQVLGTGGIAVILLAPLLMFGLGPIPGFGIVGAGMALVAFHTAGSAVMVVSLLRGNGLVRLSLAHPLRWRHFAEILRVGLLGVFNSLISNMAVAAATALVGLHGVAALAGYGLGARMEYLQIPIAFSFGSALVAMVGMNVGAGKRRRALLAAWAGSLAVGAVTAAIGISTALFPRQWLGLFTQDAAVIEAGAQYFAIVGPAYAFFGLGMALNFAAQGTGQMMWPLAAGVVRTLFVCGAGWVAAHVLGLGLMGTFVVIAVALVLFGLLNATPWLLRLFDPAWGGASPAPQKTAR